MAMMSCVTGAGMLGLARRRPPGKSRVKHRGPKWTHRGQPCQQQTWSLDGFGLFYLLPGGLCLGGLPFSNTRPLGAGTFS